MSIVVHEISHGYVALILGDSTAKNAGRLTLNPISHLDPIGSVLVPLIMSFTGGIIFGWAKPVPYNPYNLKNQKWGPALVGIAGPVSNFAVALLFGLMIRYSGFLFFLPSSFFQIAVLIVQVNLVLGVFNLMPIPPLDGSKVLFSILHYIAPSRWYEIQTFLEGYGMFLLLAFIFFFSSYVFPISFWLFRIIVGA